MIGTTTGGVVSGRCFFLHSDTGTPTCTTGGVGSSSNQAWAIDAGACITIYYHDISNGAVPPAVPNKVTIQVFFDDSGTIVKTYQTLAAEPASGTSYSFCATSDGNVGSSPRAGTYGLNVRAVKDNGVGGVGNYDLNTGTSASPCRGSPTACDRGALRAATLVSSVARSAYPAGSMFAYGASGDESVTVTATFTQPNGDANVETVFDSILDSATLLIGQAGSTVDVDAVTTLAQAFVVDQTFPAGNSPYVPGFTIVGNSVLTGLKWTVLASTGHGGGLTRVSDTFIYGATFNIDPSIKMDSDGAGGFGAADGTDKSYVGSCSGSLIELFNRGETVCQTWYLYNARSELLSRSMSFARRDSGSQCSSYGSLTPSSNQYTQTEALPTGGACAAAADTTGTPRFLRVTNTDQTYDSGTVMSVSSFLRLDADGSGTPDNNALTCISSCGSTDVTLFNRGETMDYEGYLFNARGTQYQATGVQWRLQDSLASGINTQTLSHSSGKYSAAPFVFQASDKATADTTGDPETFIVTKDGNTGTSSAGITSLSSLYFVDSHIQVGSVLVTDDYPTEDAGEYFNYVIQGDGFGGDLSDTIHHWCHVDGVRHDVNIDTTGSAVTRNIKDPATTTRATGTTDTGADGWTATSQDLLSSTPLGLSWTALCSVSFGGNSGTDTETFAVAIPVGGGGDMFMADPLKVFSSLDDGGDVLVSVSASYLDGSARTGASADIDVDIYDPTGALEANANPSEVAFGAYRLEFTPAMMGNYLILARTFDPDTLEPIGTSNTLRVGPVVSFNGTDSNDTLALLLDKLGPQGEPVNIESSTLDFWVPLVLWLVGLLFFLKLGKLLAAGASTAGLGLTLATDANMGWAALALIILVLALWLEATLMEGIYQRWFGGKTGRKAPE